MDAARARQVQLKWYERTQPFGEGTAFLLLVGACTIDAFQVGDVVNQDDAAVQMQEARQLAEYMAKHTVATTAGLCMEALWVKVKASGTRMRKQWTSIARAAAASVLLDLIHRHPDEAYEKQPSEGRAEFLGKLKASIVHPENCDVPAPWLYRLGAAAAVLHKPLASHLTNMLQPGREAESLHAALSVLAALAKRPPPGDKWLSILFDAWDTIQTICRTRGAEVDDATMARCLGMVPPMLEGWSRSEGGVVMIMRARSAFTDLYVLLQKLPLVSVRTRAAAIRGMGAALTYFDTVAAQELQGVLLQLHDQLHALGDQAAAQKKRVVSVEDLLLGVFECLLCMLRLVLSGPRQHPLYPKLTQAPSNWLLVLVYTINSTGGRLLLEPGPLDVVARECVRLWAKEGDGAGVLTLLGRCDLYEGAARPSEAALSMLMSAAKFARPQDVRAVTDKVDMLLSREHGPSAMAYGSATVTALLPLMDPSQLPPRVTSLVQHSLAVLLEPKPRRQVRAKATEEAGKEAVWAGAREGALILLTGFAQRWQAWALQEPEQRMDPWITAMDGWRDMLKALVQALVDGSGEGQEELLDAMIRLAPVLEMGLLKKLLNHVLRSVQRVLQPLAEEGSRDIHEKRQLVAARYGRATRLLSLASSLLQRPTYTGPKAPTHLLDDTAAEPNQKGAGAKPNESGKAPLSVVFTSICMYEVKEEPTEAYAALVSSGLWLVKAGLLPLDGWTAWHDQGWALTKKAIEAHGFVGMVDVVRAGLGVLEELGGPMSAGSPLKRIDMLKVLHALVISMEQDAASEESKGLRVLLGDDVALLWAQLKGSMHNIRHDFHDAISNFCAPYQTGPRWGWDAIKEDSIAQESEGEGGESNEGVSGLDPMAEDFAMDTSS